MTSSARPALGVLVLAPMILPPFVGAVGVKQMLGVNGAFNALLIKTRPDGRGAALRLAGRTAASPASC